ncbi:hypothetical protein LSTR_LSTR009864 [Laodelphax striatellus]|uniref:Uncharacterized protein n=1 Tax=Laodelphax striatellus TaxID=195883 RepID=A0A482WGV3_LAOST|nr:hypothetical protein LSTR_LSTR009864 [Laodelphax striatellus]
MTSPALTCSLPPRSSRYCAAVANCRRRAVQGFTRQLRSSGCVFQDIVALNRYHFQFPLDLQGWPRRWTQTVFF